MKKAKRERLAHEAAEVERASLIHHDYESWERDPRPGAKLVREDGSTLVERIEGVPSRWPSYASRSLVPPSARVPSAPRTDIVDGKPGSARCPVRVAPNTGTDDPRCRGSAASWPPPFGFLPDADTGRAVRGVRIREVLIA